MVKPINMIVADRCKELVVHYKDLEFYCDATEYLKRYYHRLEVLSRIHKLTGTES